MVSKPLKLSIVHSDVIWALLLQTFEGGVHAAGCLCSSRNLLTLLPHPGLVHNKTLQGCVWWLAGVPGDPVCICGLRIGGWCVSGIAQGHVYCMCLSLDACLFDEWRCINRPRDHAGVFVLLQCGATALGEVWWMIQPLARAEALLCEQVTAERHWEGLLPSACPLKEYDRKCLIADRVTHVGFIRNPLAPVWCANSARGNFSACIYVFLSGSGKAPSWIDQCCLCALSHVV